MLKYVIARAALEFDLELFPMLLLGVVNKATFVIKFIVAQIAAISWRVHHMEQLYVLDQGSLLEHVKW